MSVSKQPYLFLLPFKMLSTKTHIGNFIVAQVVVSAVISLKRLQACLESFVSNPVWPESFVTVVNQCALNPMLR